MKIKTIEEMQKESLDEFIYQLRLAGVKETTIKQILKDISDHAKEEMGKEIEKFWMQVKEIMERK